MNLLIEYVRVPHVTRDRERMMRLDNLLATARAARCQQRGCHPLMERVSRLLVSTGTRINAWAAPSHRQVRLELCRESNAASVA